MKNLVDAYKVYIASNFALYLKTHNCHFNLTGMLFYQLHKLFEEQYEDMWKAHDAIGEHMRTLDVFTPAALSEYSKYSIIDDITQPYNAEDYVTRLFMDHDRMIVLINKVIKFAEADDLQDHLNFLAERLDKHGKHRWMLRSMIKPIE